MDRRLNSLRAAMDWPYKSIVSFVDASGTRLRVRYVIRASSLESARDVIAGLLQGEGISDCLVEDVTPVSAKEQQLPKSSPWKHPAPQVAAIKKRRQNAGWTAGKRASSRITFRF